MTAENKDAKRPTRGLGAARSQQSHETASRAGVRGAQPRKDERVDNTHQQHQKNEKNEKKNAFTDREHFELDENGPRAEVLSPFNAPPPRRSFGGGVAPVPPAGLRAPAPAPRLRASDSALGATHLIPAASQTPRNGVPPLLPEDDDSDSPLASRAGYKLLAAITQFNLAQYIKGARALDLGACTGGFTDCLLRHGAAHITAMDVGPNQLRPHLRDDPRVLMLEKVHFKKLSLHVASGPFEFFVVDVSHVAARSMLRGLSKRIEPGTHGVVLLKPQFELPAVLMPRGGVVESKNLRKLAFNRFKKKAHKYGFEILDRANSPVAGGSGTIEILLHLRYNPPPAATKESAPVDGPPEPPTA